MMSVKQAGMFESDLGINIELLVLECQLLLH